ncbi:hypothetical protein HDU88_006689 [Geranomyces variabilis]|nr:hypothetical protein HDU88_006689 [Geranomyces variabilis]
MSSYDIVPATPAEAKISDLAATARKEEKADPLWKRLNIPLLVLAPALILLSLAAVVVPVSVVLANSSRAVTEDLSQTYFGNILANTQEKVLRSLDPQRYALYAVGSLPSTAKAMTNQWNLLAETGLWNLMAQISIKYDLDGIQCYTAKWAPGVPQTPPGTWATTNVTYINLGRKAHSPFTDTAVAVEDFSTPGAASQWAIDQTNYSLLNETDPTTGKFYAGAQYWNYTTYAMNGYFWPIYSRKPWDVTNSPLVQQLLLANPKRDPFFGMSYNGQGLRGASISQVFTSADPSLNYGCGATITVESRWNQLLIEAAGVNTPNKILLLANTEDLALVSTSNRNISFGVALTQGVGSNETLSQSLRAAVLSKYGTYSAMAADPTLGTSFEAQVEGETWILLVDRVKLSGYDSDQLVVVLAVPHASIFSRIDSAQKKSLGVAIGLSIGIGILMALFFAVIVTPLRRLAHAMGLLTSMDFASLHKGTVLEQKSAITEIREVQRTFSTMVKAFAGGIKQNRDLHGAAAKAATGSRSQSGSTASAAGMAFSATAQKRGTREFV